MADPPKPRRETRRTSKPRTRQGPDPFVVKLVDQITRNAEARALYAEGWRVDDIAHKYGMTTFRMYTAISSPKLGVTHRQWQAWKMLAESNAYVAAVIKMIEGSPM